MPASRSWPAAVWVMTARTVRFSSDWPMTSRCPAARSGLIEASVPGHALQQQSHAAEPADTREDQPGADESRQQKQPGRQSVAQQHAQQHQAAGGDHYLPLQLQRLGRILLHLQTGRLPGLDAPFEHVGLAADAAGQSGLVHAGTLAAPTVENDRLASGQIGAGSTQLIYRKVARTADTFPGVLIRTADIHQYRPGVQQLPGRLRRNGLQRHQYSLPWCQGQNISFRVPSKRSTLDRKSTRLNSSHVRISYAVFCLKKKKQHNTRSN